VEQARRLLKRLIDKPLHTITQEKPNWVRAVEGDYAYVEREQSGRVPIADVQAAIDVLYRDGKLRINKATLGHSNTAFVGAVLRELPDAEVLTRPQRVRISGRAS
jgi:hypothetical protein